MNLFFFDICIFVKRLFVCLITTATTVMVCSQLNPHQINMLIQYSQTISLTSQKLTKISDSNARKYFYPIARLLVEMDGYKNTEIDTDVDYSSIRVDNEIEEASKYFII